jgi:hypothetical protein
VTQHGPKQSVAKIGNGRRVRARGHDDSQGWRCPEIDQSRREVMAGESGREGTAIAKDGAKATTIAKDNAKAKKADEEEAANFFFSKCALCGRKEAGIMPSAMMGAASPWFTGAGSDLLVVK